MSDNEKPHEIVIVRRRHGGDHDEPHGGVWKVAFADFMTAMMAFFLVLWIVNSTSKETRASVARYFNPVRLSDTTPARKGLQDPREEDFDAAKTDNDKKGASGDSDTPSQVKKDDHKSAKDEQKDDHKKDEHKAKEEAKPAPAPKSAPGAQPSMSAGPGPTLATDVATARGVPGQAVVERYRDPFEPMAPMRLEPMPSRTGDVKPPLPEAPKPASAEAAPKGESAVAAADRLTTEGLKAKLGAKDADGAKNAPTIEVIESPEGTLISLTDRADYSMFSVGSTEPNAKVVALMASLGGIIKPMKGVVVVRGFTDARRFRGGGNDNWRLSTARAQWATDQLLRGGLDEKRIERIEGHADRRLRNPQDPDAAENRRIEILLKKGAA